MRQELSVLDLFSGIGGFSLGFQWAGFRTLAFCERDAFCRGVLARHWPGIPIFADIRSLPADRLRPDVVCGGFPCQDISLAGRGAGLAGARSGLWSEMRRVIAECQPRWVVAENVPALRSRGADRVIADLAALGYACWPLVVGAVHAGAPHRRRRVFVVARRVAADAGGERLEVRQRGATQPAARVQAERHGGWQAEPGLRRVDDGLPGRVDRVRALGNAVVPALAAMIGHAIQAAEAA